MLVEIKGHLAGAQDDFLVAVLRASVVLHNDGMELGASGKVVEVADSLRVLQADLGCGHDQRLAVIAQHLSPEQVEEVGRQSWLRHDEVDVAAVKLGCVSVVVDVGVRVLQETLDVTGAVLGAGTVETVRQQQHKTRLPHPLGLAAHEIVVDQQLRRVEEVAKLRLPESQVLWRLQAVAVLVGHDAELAQVRVEHLEAALADANERHNFLARVLIRECRMSLVERATLAVLAHQAHIVAVLGETREGHGLGSGPVHASLIETLQSICDVHFGEPGVHVEAVGNCNTLDRNILQNANIVARVLRFAAMLRRHYTVPLVRVGS